MRSIPRILSDDLPTPGSTQEGDVPVPAEAEKFGLSQVSQDACRKSSTNENFAMRTCEFLVEVIVYES